MKDYLTQILLMALVIMGAFSLGYASGEDAAYIKTADVIFSRCNSNNSMWCLNADQYQTIIEQLSARKQ